MRVLGGGVDAGDFADEDGVGVEVGGCEELWLGGGG